MDIGMHVNVTEESPTVHRTHLFPANSQLSGCALLIKATRMSENTQAHTRLYKQKLNETLLIRCAVRKNFLIIKLQEYKTECQFEPLKWHIDKFVSLTRFVINISV